MKEQIQQLVSEGRTEDALALLVQHNTDALILGSRFNAAKKQYNMGMIEFGEWNRVLAQINYALFEMARNIKSPTPIPAAGPALQPTVAQPSGDAASIEGVQKNRVLISYDYQDSSFVRKVKDFLSENGFSVDIDLNDMSVGKSTQGFIDEALRGGDYVISIVSRHSLLSGWTYRELTVIQFLSQLSSFWVPVSIDDAVFSKDFFFEAIDNIDQKINRGRGQIKKALESNIDIALFTDELSRLQDLKASIPSTLADLKDRHVIDISGRHFDLGMAKVIERIHPSK
ncbi:MAG: TIR domain-containing protein [Saprospiraceae bacterium]